MIKRTLSTEVTCEGCFFRDSAPPVDDKGPCNKTPEGPCVELDASNQIVYYIFKEEKDEKQNETMASRGSATQ
jgi:hypothetical protein